MPPGTRMLTIDSAASVDFETMASKALAWDDRRVEARPQVGAWS